MEQPWMTTASDRAGRRNLDKLRALYSSCMNESHIESVGRQPLVDVIKNIVDLFPVKVSPFTVIQDLTALKASGETVTKKSSRIDEQALTKTLAYFSEIGIDSIMTFGVVPNTADPARNIFKIQPGSANWISKQYYSIGKRPEDFEATTKLFAEISYLLTRKEDVRSFSASGEPNLSRRTIRKKWTKFARGAFIFERLLRSQTQADDTTMFITVQELRDKSRGPTTVEITSALARKFDIMLKTGDKRKSKESPLAAQSYFVWKAIEQLGRHVSPKYRQSLAAAHSEENERWKYCVGIVNSNLGRVAGHFFVETSFRKDNQIAAEEVDKYVRQAFINAYADRGWLNKTGLIRILHPERNESVVFLGHSSNIPGSGASEALESFYEEYDVKPNDFFGNLMRYAIWHRENSFKNLDDSAFLTTVQELPQHGFVYRNAYGDVKIPAGVLQPTFFDARYPQYVKFAGLGVKLAREYARDLDIGAGRLAELWNPFEAPTNVSTRLECYKKKYEDFGIGDPDRPSKNLALKRGSEWRLGEDIAGSIGLEQAYQA
ncbi:Peptidase M13 [Mortierella alpina]|nr:Peptidase M13 [Mortierella alpina]